MKKENEELRLREAWRTWFALEALVAAKKKGVFSITAQQADDWELAFRGGWAGAKLS